MATLLKTLAAGLCGVMLGLLVTIYSLRPDSRGVAAGPWRGTPQEGASDIDPYALAAIERAGTLPPGAGEGVAFRAVDDSAGQPLSAACNYTVSGPIPTARFWTLGVLSPVGSPIANAADRYAFTSADVLRDGAESAVVAVGPDARSGNWLPVGRGAAGFVLALRLYDTGLSVTDTRVSANGFPVIARRQCR